MPRKHGDDIAAFIKRPDYYVPPENEIPMTDKLTITITGPQGSGKTRWAMHLANHVPIWDALPIPIIVDGGDEQWSWPQGRHNAATVQHIGPLKAGDKIRRKENVGKSDPLLTGVILHIHGDHAMVLFPYSNAIPGTGRLDEYARV